METSNKIPVHPLEEIVAGPGPAAAPAENSPGYET